MSWQNAIILESSERVLHSWDGDCERGPLAAGEAKQKDSGTLLITNLRLQWFGGSGGLSKTQRVSFEINLRNIRKIACGGTVDKWVSITDGKGEYVFHLHEASDDEIESFRNMILRQMDSMETTATSSTPFVQVPAVVPKEFITEEVAMVPCGHCQRLMSQTSGFCPNCGAARKFVSLMVSSGTKHH